MHNYGAKLSARRRRLWAVVVVAAAGAVTCTGALARPPAGRALFVRDQKLVGSSAQATELLDFCSAMGVKLLLVSVSEPPQDHAGQWEQFLPRAHSRGLSVHAVGGEPDWGLGTEGEERPRRRFQPKPPFEHLNGILTYNLPRRSNQRFDGVLHEIDVWAAERYQQADRASRHAMLSFCIEILRGCRRVVERLGQPVEYGAVIPPDADTEVTRAWQDEEGEAHEYTGPAYTHIIGVVDYVVVRGEADQVDALIDAARDEMQMASRLAGSAYLAVQTAAANGVPAEATFGDDGRAAMERVLPVVEEAFAEQKGFRGVAIDCYGTYRAMEP